MSARPTRSQVIGAMVFTAVLESRLVWNAYADAVVRHYHAHVAQADRIVNFHVAGTAADVARCEDLNTQTVKRLLSGEIRMAVDIEESLLGALPAAQRDRVLAALLARDGLILARQPSAPGDALAQQASACDLLRQTAGAVERIAPMLADGKGIGPEDAQHFADARVGLRRVMGVCVTLDAQIDLAAAGGRAAVN